MSKRKIFTYTGVGNRTDAEEGRPVRGQATLPTLLQQLVVERQLARDDGRCGGGRPDLESPHRPGCRLDSHRSGNQVGNRGRRQLHKKIIKAY